MASLDVTFLRVFCKKIYAFGNVASCIFVVSLVFSTCMVVVFSSESALFSSIFLALGSPL